MDDYKVWFDEVLQGQFIMAHSVNIRARSKEEAVKLAQEYLERVAKQFETDEEAEFQFNHIQTLSGDFRLVDGYWFRGRG